jgi:hypothetical protein
MNHQSIPKLSGDGYFSFQPLWQQNPVHCLVIEKIVGLDVRTVDHKCDRDAQTITSNTGN